MAQIELADDEIWWEENWDFKPQPISTPQITHAIPKPAQVAEIDLNQFKIPLTQVNPEVDLNMDSCLDFDSLQTRVNQFSLYQSNHHRPILWSTHKTQPALMIFAHSPTPLDLSEKQIFSQEEGLLLNNMLQKVLGLQRDECYLSLLQKSLFSRKILPREREPLRIAFEKEIRLTQPKALLCLGVGAVWDLLQVGSPIEELFARELHFAGIPLFLTHSLGEMQSNPNLRKNSMPALLRLKEFISVNR